MLVGITPYNHEPTGVSNTAQLGYVESVGFWRDWLVCGKIWPSKEKQKKMYLLLALACSKPRSKPSKYNHHQDSPASHDVPCGKPLDTIDQDTMNFRKFYVELSKIRTLKWYTSCVEVIIRVILNCPQIVCLNHQYLKIGDRDLKSRLFFTIL